jgi:hypothetical protein
LPVRVNVGFGSEDPGDNLELKSPAIVFPTRSPPALEQHLDLLWSQVTASYCLCFRAIRWIFSLSFLFFFGNTGKEDMGNLFSALRYGILGRGLRGD